jgi:uncharacterized membrane protein
MTKKVRLGLWALAFVLATGLSWLIPPMQSPDETSHVARAYLMAQGHWLLQDAPSDVAAPTDTEVASFVRRLGGQADAGGLVDASLLRFMASNLKLVLDAKLRLPAAEQERLATLRWSNNRIHFSIPRTGYYFPLVYAPQAAGLALGMALDWSVEISYRLARSLTLLICFALLAAACRLAPPSPLALATLLLPMSLFQLLSPTLDGLTTSLGLLAISLFLRKTAVSGSSTWRFSILLAVCVFILVTSRTHLLPLLLLPFFVAWRQRSGRDFYLASIVVVGSLAWVLFALHSTTDTLVVRSQSSSELLVHYAAHPAAFFKIVWATVSNPDVANFYQQSFIGILGWLDTSLPVISYPMLWVGLGACALVSISLPAGAGDWSARCLLLVAAMSSIGLIFLSQLVTWTAHPATVIEGVQGRYFVMPMVLLGYVLSGLARPSSRLQGQLAALSLSGFTLCSLTALSVTLLSRYH